MLDLDGRKIWKASLMPTYPKDPNFRIPPNMIGAEWFYPETLFVQMAGVDPVQLNPDSGLVVRQTVWHERISDHDFHPDSLLSSSRYLANQEWLTSMGPYNICKILRSGYLELPGQLLMEPCLGWKGVSSGGVLHPSSLRLKEYDFSLTVLLKCESFFIFRCSYGKPTQHLRIVRDSDFSSGFPIENGVDAFITGDLQFVVSLHHDHLRNSFWLECRCLNDLEKDIWRTASSSWINWFMGAGNTVWYTDMTFTEVSKKDWLVGLDLETGRELSRKEESCRYFGMFCGPYLITGGHVVSPRGSRRVDVEFFGDQHAEVTAPQGAFVMAPEAPSGWHTQPMMPLLWS